MHKIPIKNKWECKPPEKANIPNGIIYEKIVSMSLI
jgi:hypothetical protein